MEGSANETGLESSDSRVFLLPLAAVKRLGSSVVVV